MIKLKLFGKIFNPLLFKSKTKDVNQLSLFGESLSVGDTKPGKKGLLIVKKNPSGHGAHLEYVNKTEPEKKEKQIPKIAEKKKTLTDRYAEKKYTNPIDVGGEKFGLRHVGAEVEKLLAKNKTVTRDELASTPTFRQIKEGSTYAVRFLDDLADAGLLFKRYDKNKLFDKNNEVYAENESNFKENHITKEEAIELQNKRKIAEKPAEASLKVIRKEDVKVGDIIYFPTEIGLRLIGVEEDIRKNKLSVKKYKVAEIDKEQGRIIIESLFGKKIQHDKYFNDEFIEIINKTAKWVSDTEKPAAKQPHEMTQKEFIKQTRDDLGEQHRVEFEIGGETGAGVVGEHHKKLIKEAIKNGQNVSDTVLKDYPGLKNEIPTKSELHKTSKSNYEKENAKNPNAASYPFAIRRLLENKKFNSLNDLLAEFKKLYDEAVEDAKTPLQIGLRYAAEVFESTDKDDYNFIANNATNFYDKIEQRYFRQPKSKGKIETKFIGNAITTLNKINNGKSFLAVAPNGLKPTEIVINETAVIAGGNTIGQIAREAKKLGLSDETHTIYQVVPNRGGQPYTYDYSIDDNLKGGKS